MNNCEDTHDSGYREGANILGVMWDIIQVLEAYDYDSYLEYAGNTNELRFRVYRAGEWGHALSVYDITVDTETGDVTYNSGVSPKFLSQTLLGAKGGE